MFDQVAQVQKSMHKNSADKSPPLLKLYYHEKFKIVFYGFKCEKSYPLEYKYIICTKIQYQCPPISPFIVGWNKSYVVRSHHDYSVKVLQDIMLQKIKYQISFIFKK